MRATQSRLRLRQQRSQLEEQADGVAVGAEQAAQERAKRPAKRALLEMRRRLTRKYGTITRAWKKVHGQATKEIGRDGWLTFFEEVGMSNAVQDANKAWDLMPTGEGEKLSLLTFEPGIARDWEDFQLKLKERYSNAKTVLMEMREHGPGLQKRKFLELCYECKTLGNENRLFEYLEEDGKVDFEKIDEKAGKEVKEVIAAEEEKRKEEEKREARLAKLAKKKEKEKAARDGDSATDSGSPSGSPKSSPKGSPKGSQSLSRLPSPAAEAQRKAPRPKVQMPAGLGHLALGMKPRQVKLTKSSSLPAVGLRCLWNDRHHVAEHRGNRDMNLLHQLMAVETQGAEKCRARVRNKLEENPTMAWYEELLRIEEERNAQLWATEMHDTEEDEEEDDEEPDY